MMLVFLLVEFVEEIVVVVVVGVVVVVVDAVVVDVEVVVVDVEVVVVNWFECVDHFAVWDVMKSRMLILSL